MKACWPVRSALALSGVFALANTLDAHPLDHWSTRRTNAASVYFFGVTYGNGTWVAVSGGGSPVYSSDLESWKIVTSAPSVPSVAFGNGTFVAVFNRIIQSDPVIQLQFGPENILSLSGPTNAIYRIEATGDAGVSNSWQLVTNVLVDTSPYVWSDPEFANYDRRFYRALLP